MTLKPLTFAVPCVGFVVNAIDVVMPLMVGDSTLLLLFPATMNSFPDKTGAEAITLILTVAVPEVPPGPTAEKLKLSEPA